MTRRRLAFVIPGALLASLLACSHQDSGAIPPRPTQEPVQINTPGLSSGCPDARQVFQAVQAYSDAYLTGHVSTAYRLLSQRCQARMTREQFASAVALASAKYGVALPIKRERFHADVSRQVVALATYSYGIPTLDEDRQRWVREDGGWREDDC